MNKCTMIDNKIVPIDGLEYIFNMIPAKIKLNIAHIKELHSSMHIPIKP